MKNRMSPDLSNDMHELKKSLLRTMSKIAAEGFEDDGNKEQFNACRFAYEALEYVYNKLKGEDAE